MPFAMMQSSKPAASAGGQNQILGLGWTPELIDDWASAAGVPWDSETAE